MHELDFVFWFAYGLHMADTKKVVKLKPQSEFKRVRDVTHEEHGITKPYKGVYACIVCGDEQVMDNQIEKGKQYE